MCNVQITLSRLILAPRKGRTSLIMMSESGLLYDHDCIHVVEIRVNRKFVKEQSIALLKDSVVTNHTP